MTISWERQGTMKLEIPVNGGTLWLTNENQGGRLSFEYKGFLRYDWAHELIKNSTDNHLMTINGQPVLAWVEGLLPHAVHDPTS